MLTRRGLLQGGAGLTASALLSGRVGAAKLAAPEDIALLDEILRTLHPGLYRYQSPKAFEQSLGALENAWAAQPDLASRYLNLSRFLAKIKCGHSYANFFNQSKTIQSALFDQKTRLPFTFRWVGKQMVVLKDQSGTGLLPKGTVVHAIDAVPASDILHRLMPYVRADGNNDAKRRALLSVTGGDTIETFDVFHGLLYDQTGLKGRNTTSGLHSLRVELPGASAHRLIDVAALDLSQRQAFMAGLDYRGSEPVWQWTVRPDGIAVLRMDGWGLYNSSWNWAGWLNDRLDSLNGAKGLIVDIRENEGGIDCGDLILARISGRDVAKPKFKRMVRYTKTPEHLDRYLDTWDDSFRDWSNQIAAREGNFYCLRQEADATISAAGSKKLDVPMVVLTSAQNSSATFQFAGLTKQLGLGTLLGEATGGNQRGINGGAFFFARLPQSGIEFDVPLIGFFPDGRKPDAGLSPDISVAMTPQAIAAGTDPQLQAAVDHLMRT